MFLQISLSILNQKIIMLNNRFKSFLIIFLVLFFCLDLIACDHTENKITPIAQPTSVTQPTSRVYIKKNKPDYYVLALSWSPEYCKTHKQGMQCNRQPQQAYRFVLHGLWPSLDKTCTQEKLSETVIDATLPFIPSKKLIKHEWKKHGRCSGYNPKQFFDLSIQAYEKIKIPNFFNHVEVNTTKKVNDIKESFIKENPKLKYDAIRVVNIKKEFSELRVCLDKSFQAINCPLPPISNPNAEIVITPPVA